MKWFIKRRGQLLLLCASLCFAVVLAELGLRFMGVTYPVVDRVDEFSGWGYAPNRTWTYRDEGHALIAINSFGYRDHEWQLTKPDGVFRIAVLGDSYVEALQVEKEARFTEQLAELLNQQNPWHPKHVEVMNFGIGGFGTSQELQTLRHRVLPFKPDAVILAVLTGNDIRDNSRRLDGDDMRPYFTLQGDDLKLDASFQTTDGYRGGLLKSTVRGVARYSVIAQLALKVRRTRQVNARQQNSVQNDEAGLDDSIYAKPKNEDWEDAWHVTERLIREVANETVRAGSQFYCVTLSNGIQVFPDPKKREAFEAKAAVESLFYADDRLEQYATTHGITFLKLAPSLQRIAEKQQTFLHGFQNTRMGTGHWNADGHREAAKLIADWLRTAATGSGS